MARLERAVAVIAAGGMAVVDDDREDGGDLVMAASRATPEDVNFMTTHGRGLLCVAMPGARLASLRIASVATAGDDPRDTAFHVGVDRRGGTGAAISERARTIRALADPEAAAGDFRQPGHVFPLAARPGGVLVREGHTEAAVDLCRLAGAGEVAVLGKVLRPDGELARGVELRAFAGQHALPLLAIADLVADRRRREPLVERVTETKLPIRRCDFHAVGYRELLAEHEHVALVLGDLSAGPAPLVSVHAECLAGDVFASRRCGCRADLGAAIDRIGAEGRGAIVYLRDHRGRHAALHGETPCGLPADAHRDSVGAQILDDLGARAVRLAREDAAIRTVLEDRGIAVRPAAPAAVA